MALDPMTGVAAAADARSRRSAALVRVRAAAERGDFRHCLADLFTEAARDPALMRLHIWRVEQAAFDNKTSLCKRHARLAAQWCGTDAGRGGTLTLAWLLDGRTGGARLSAWLMAISFDLKDEKGGHPFVPSGADPFAALRT